MKVLKSHLSSFILLCQCYFRRSGRRRIIALLDQVFPEYEKLFSDTFGKTSKELFLQCPTPEDMLAVSTRKLTNLLNKAGLGRFGEEKAKEIRSTAAGSFGIGFAKNAFAFQIRQIIEQLMFSENQIEELEEQISLLLHQTNQVITTISGIGDTLGAVIISEIGDIHRFDALNKDEAGADWTWLLLCRFYQ